MKNTLTFLLTAATMLWTQAARAEMIKRGWNLGFLPVAAYNSDLGFEYGALINLIDFGDGGAYPNYKQKLYFEASRYTKGSGIYRIYYDAPRFYRTVRLIADLSLLPDRAYDFYGFNGYEALYHPEWEESGSETYKTRVFYKYDRNYLRLKADLQGQLSGALKWIAGLNAQNFEIASVDVDRLNKGKDEEDKLPSTEGLYDKYVRWGFIPEKEKNGGRIITLKAGAVFDTRDVIANPGRGLWTEAVVVAASPGWGSKFAFAKLCLTHRQYFTLLPNRLTLAYRLGWQSTFSGKTPFFYLPMIETSELTAAKSEGLGGDRFTRGIRRNRIIGEGVAFGNFELRTKLLRFVLLRQNMYIGLNTFLDTGVVTKKVNWEVSAFANESVESWADYIQKGAEKLHTSTGLGLKIAMNENFILSIDYGRALNAEDGDSGLYIALNYLF